MRASRAIPCTRSDSMIDGSVPSGGSILKMLSVLTGKPSFIMQSVNTVNAIASISRSSSSTRLNTFGMSCGRFVSRNARTRVVYVVMSGLWPLRTISRYTSWHFFGFGDLTHNVIMPLYIVVLIQPTCFSWLKKKFATPCLFLYPIVISISSPWSGRGVSCLSSITFHTRMHSLKHPFNAKARAAAE